MGQSVHAGFPLPEGATILTGPAGSGKTPAVLDLYRACTGPDGRSRCLLLLPNLPAAGQVRLRLLEQTPAGVLVEPSVTTFAGLAGRILSGAGRAVSRLGTVQRHLLLGGIVGELKSAGRLKALGALSDTPGLVSALDAAIAELKRAAVEPDALAAAMGAPEPKDADLLAVYREYQRRLKMDEQYDVEGLMWEARDVLRAGESLPGCEGLQAVAADGFTDFTPTQLDILALLWGRVGRLLVTLPLGDRADGRLWEWVRRTLQRLRRALPEARVERAERPGAPLQSLFDLAGGSEPPRPPRPAGEAHAALTFVQAPDVETEVRWTAAAVKRQLVEGAECGSVAVLARNLEPYAECIERTFAACDVPVAPRPCPLATAGIVRFVLNLLALPPEYRFGDLLGVIQSSYFRPGSLGDFDDSTVATAATAVRWANVLGGRREYAAAFARLIRRAESPREGDEEDAGLELGALTVSADSLRRAAAMVEALMDGLDGLAQAHDPGAYVAAVRRVIGDLQLDRAACAGGDDRLVAADLRALRALDELLDDLAGAAAPEEATAEGLARWTARAAAVANCPPERGESLVAVLDVLDARALAFQSVYLLGVNEKVFPQLAAERCFINEADRARWAGRGEVSKRDSSRLEPVALDRRSDLLAREMLLFYLAATRGRRLTVSYAMTDSAGGTQGPSVFVEELLAAAEREGIPHRRVVVPAGQVVPPAEELASPLDAFHAAVESAFQRDGAKEWAPLLGWAAGHEQATLACAAWGLVASHRRWRGGAVDAFDGRIDDPRLLDALKARIPGDWVFTATQLNAYAQCPWRFFAQYLLRLDVLPEPARQMTPAEGGTFCHHVLWRVFSALAGPGRTPVRLADVEEDRLREVLADAVARERDRLSDLALCGELWQAQTDYWQGMLWSYLRARRAEAGQAEAIAFELGFGASRRRDDRRDPASRSEPIEIDAAGTRIRLAGKIDRVDRVVEDGGPMPLAVDYKSGSIPSAGDILTGRDLQLAVYVAALEALLGEAGAGGEYHGLRDGAVRAVRRSQVPTARGGPSMTYDQVMDGSMQAVAGCVEGMRQGRFDALPGHDCPSWCPYRRICHYSPARARRKAPAGGAGAQEGGDE